MMSGGEARLIQDILIRPGGLAPNRYNASCDLKLSFDFGSVVTRMDVLVPPDRISGGQNVDQGLDDLLARTSVD